MNGTFAAGAADTDDVAFLLAASEQQRADWIAAQTAMGPNSLLGLLTRIRHQIDHDAADRVGLAALYLWLVQYGRKIAWLSDFDACSQTAYFVAGLWQAGLANGLRAVLPSADTIVRTCLDLIPLDQGDVPDDRDLRHLSIEEMRWQRRAKNLIKAALGHRSHIEDPELAAQLQIWVDILPRLA